MRPKPSVYAVVLLGNDWTHLVCWQKREFIFFLFNFFLVVLNIERAPVSEH